jgi:hypothetical protein
MTPYAPLHPDDGIVRSHRFAWYVAAGVDCEPFNRDAWRQLELERLGLAKTKTTSKSAPVIVGKRRALPKAKR